ncbi:hypothetical protein H4R99_003336 [Coemansia sp. RSA 1722]|nr:hypothetical protein IWW45_003319 [Coemansia sp. RSA 485]KAJ2600449.1 hypothetical protein H4R99_003336 [Coemansia sp. RSA 1722]KAJ2602182.1 hypothetical protein GGF39_000888 [Coemansia sp. RSA 1721]
MNSSKQSSSPATKPVDKISSSSMVLPADSVVHSAPELPKLRPDNRGNNSSSSINKVMQLNYYGSTNLSIQDTGNSLSDPVPNDNQQRTSKWRKLLDPEFYPEITIRRTVFFFIWTIPHIIICAYRGANKRRNLANRMNRTSMECILFDLGAILVFMSPTFLSLLRRTFLPRFITFEKNIHAHKVASYTMLFWSAIHIGYYYNQYIKQTKPGMKRGKPSPGTPLVHNLFEIKTGWTGHVLTFALFLIVVTSIKPIRKRLFEVFYYVHHLFIVYIAVMYIHHRAYMTRKYVSGPLALYCVDRLYRSMRSVFAKSPVRAVVQHPSGLVEIQLEKKIFGHRPGQFVKVYCPSVSLMQWHPMTISSAPEEELLTIHFRLYGGWTKLLSKRLGCQFPDDNVRNSDAHALVATCIGKDAVSFGRHRQSLSKDAAGAVDCRLAIPYHPLHQDPTTAPMYSQAGGNSSYVSIDMVSKGRRGAIRSSALAASNRVDDEANGDKKDKPSVAIYDAKHSGSAADSALSQLESGGSVLRVGQGLPWIFIDGPYSSPTEHFFEYEVGVLIAAGIGVTPAASVLRSVYFKWLHSPDKLPCKKVYLFWVYRDIRTLEWFKDLLIALDEEGLGSIVEVRTYYTGQISGPHVPQAAAAGDVFGDQVVESTIGTQSYVGRPDFGDIFDAVGANHPNTRIGTFFCGPKPMLRKTRREAHSWDKKLRKRSGTKLDFHSEVFF